MLVPTQPVVLTRICSFFFFFSASVERHRPGVIRVALSDVAAGTGRLEVIHEISMAITYIHIFSQEHCPEVNSKLTRVFNLLSPSFEAILRIIAYLLYCIED